MSTPSNSEENNKQCQSTSNDATTGTTQLQKRGKIILLGDSITQMSFSAELSGWGSYIADIYQRRCDVYNRGMSGYNTDWFLRYLNTKEGEFDVFGMMADTDSSNNSVKLVTIFFGANDASCIVKNPRHHVPLSRFELNLKEIVSKCQMHYGQSVKFIFITPPPVCHQSRLEFQIKKFKEKATGELERTLQLSGAYANVVERVAKELKVPCLNVWKEMQEGLSTSTETSSSLDGETKEVKEGEKHPWSIYLSDGLHLSREGNLFVGKRLATLISQVYPDITVKGCPFTNYTGNSGSKGGLGLGNEGGIGPWHDEIDHLDAETAFNSKTSSHKKRKVQ